MCLGSVALGCGCVCTHQLRFYSQRLHLNSGAANLRDFQVSEKPLPAKSVYGFVSHFKQPADVGFRVSGQPPPVLNVWHRIASNMTLGCCLLVTSAPCEDALHISPVVPGLPGMHLRVLSVRSHGSFNGVSVQVFVLHVRLWSVNLLSVALSAPSVHV